MSKKFKYPLLSNAFNSHDIKVGINVLKSKFITMSTITYNFEKYFAKKMGSKYAVMTNSGSSANLLAISCLTNPLSKNKLTNGDEVIIPAVCWSTSLWPLIQNNLKPVFADVELDTFNLDLDKIEKKITKKTKAIMLVHVLGISTNMNRLKKIINKHNLILIEDTCESLGASYNGKKLGTIGKFGTYSFYYSHQITSGEGGMVVCDDVDDYNILKSLRSHGWSRNTTFHKKISKKFNKLDKRFLFIGPGYNVRPTEIQSAIAFNQFKRLNKFMEIRNQNRDKIIKSLKNHRKWNDQFKFVKIDKKIEPSWFGLPILVNNKYKKVKNLFLENLSKKGIENRPIISGNFLNQPASKFYNFNFTKNDFKNSNEVENRGFFIGLHTKKISKIEINKITENLFDIDKYL
jgi:dTDP-4-amino-4,6-dideoxygalactose transaminase